MSFNFKLFSKNIKLPISFEFFLSFCILILCSFIVLFHYNYIVLMNDDYFVLAERVFFQNNASIEWLQHLLFFNQTRLTWVGDFSLFRPGLFFLQWLYFEILFPINPKLVSFTVATFNILSLMGIFYAIKRYSNVYFGVFAVLSMSVIDRGSVIYVWAHINPYIISIGLFSWWLAFFNKKNHWAVLFLFGSTLFHDIFGIFLIFISSLVIFKAIRIFLSNNSFKIEYISVIICSLIYLIFRITIFISFHEINLENFNPLVSYFHSFHKDWIISVKNFFIEFFKRSSFNLISKEFVPILILIIIILLSLSLKKKSKDLDTIYLFSPILFVIFFILVILSGRVVISGNYGDWYIIFIQFCALCIWISIFQYFKKYKITFSVFFILVLLKNIPLFYKESHNLRDVKIQNLRDTKWNLIHEIVSNKSKNECLAGFIPKKSKNEVFDPQKGVSSDLEPIPFREYYILFRSFFCEKNMKSQKPFYIINYKSRNDLKFEKKINYFSKKFIDAKVNSNSYISSLNGFHSSATPLNFFETRNKNRKKFITKKFLPNPEPNGYKIRIKLNINENDRMYNIGFAFKKNIDQLPSSIVSLIDNDILVWSKDEKKNKYILVGSGIIPFSSNYIDLEYIYTTDKICFFKINNIIATATNKCIPYPHYIEAVALNNGTSSEQSITLYSPKK